MLPPEKTERHLSYFKSTGEIYEPVSGINVFPNPDYIFADSSTMLAEYFFPVLSIDLGIVNRDWKGKIVHMLTMVTDPYSYEDIFDTTIAKDCAHMELTWLTFKLNDKSQYERIPKDDDEAMMTSASISKDNDPNYQTESEEAHEHYAFAKSHYATYGQKYWPLRDEHVRRVPIIDQLGGELFEDNWCNDIPDAFSLSYGDGDTIFVETEAGNPFYLIATTSGFYWPGSAGSTTFLLYEPVSELVAIVMNHD